MSREDLDLATSAEEAVSEWYKWMFCLQPWAKNFYRPSLEGSYKLKDVVSVLHNPPSNLQLTLS